MFLQPFKYDHGKLALWFPDASLVAHYALQNFPKRSDGLLESHYVGLLPDGTFMTPMECVMEDTGGSAEKTPSTRAKAF